MSDKRFNNDIFFLCSLIEYVARKTCNTKKYTVDKIGYKKIKKIFDLASVYHSENIDKITDEIVYECNIEIGNYDIFSKITNTNPPTYWDMGKVYSRLILMLSENEKDCINKLIEVLTSWIIPEFDNYDSSLYFESPNYILECYKENKII